MNKVIRYVKEVEDEFGKPTNKWAVYEEKSTKDGNACFFDAKIVKTFPSPYHARNWMEDENKRFD